MSVKLLPLQTNTRTHLKGNDGFEVSTQASENHARFQTGYRTWGRWWAGRKVERQGVVAASIKFG